MLESLRNPKVKKIIEDAIGGCDQQTATVLDLSFVQPDLLKLILNHILINMKCHIFDFQIDQGKHKFHHCRAEGILVFLIDRREGKAFYLRVLHPATLEVKFSVELYFGFIESWSPVRGFNNFYAFPFSKGFVGMLFVNDQEAQRITQKIRQYAPSKKDLEKLNQQLKEEEKLIKAYQQQEKEKDSFSYQFKAFFGKEKVEKPIQIGTPQNVKRNTLSLNVETGEIDIDKLPPVLIEVFLNAGITKKDLQDKAKAKEIFKTVARFSDKNSQATQLQSNQLNKNSTKQQQQQATNPPSQKQNPIQQQQQSNKPSVVIIVQLYKIFRIKLNPKFLFLNQSRNIGHQFCNIFNSINWDIDIKINIKVIFNNLNQNI